MSADLTLEDFASHTGTPYRFEGQGYAAQLTLESASTTKSYSTRAGGPFVLYFRGPRGPILPQGTYAVTGGGRSHDIFIVPVAVEPAGALYESLFN